MPGAALPSWAGLPSGDECRRLEAGKALFFGIKTINPKLVVSALRRKCDMRSYVICYDFVSSSDSHTELTAVTL